MATVNVYVSDDLKAAMGEHELNWSRLAADAFETAINLERTKAMSIEQGSIERLRVSRVKASDRREAEGVALGKQWAQEQAEYDELERVAKIDTDNLMDQEGSFTMELAAALLDESRLSWAEVGDAMETLFGRSDPSYAEVCGFINGATEVFDQV
jgi:hypothetical protein